MRMLRFLRLVADPLIDDTLRSDLQAGFGIPCEDVRISDRANLVEQPRLSRKPDCASFARESRRGGNTKSPPALCVNSPTHPSETRYPYAQKSPHSRNWMWCARRANPTRMSAARVVTDAGGRAPHAGCPARVPRDTRAPSSRDSALASRNTARVEQEYPSCAKSHRNSLTRRFAGSAQTRRRESRRAAAGVHSCHIVARVARRARCEVSSRARARVPR